VSREEAMGELVPAGTGDITVDRRARRPSLSSPGALVDGVERSGTGDHAGLCSRTWE
jgi:hypothetical protein